MSETFDVIYAYTVEDALQDGVFIDISSLASKAGFKAQVVITSSLYEKYVKMPKALEGTDFKEEGRLLNLLWELTLAAKANKAETSILEFTVPYLMPPIVMVKHWACIQGFSQKDPRPVITIMLPEDY